MGTYQNRNFRNRQFREAGEVQTGAPRPSAHMQNSDRAQSFREAAIHNSAGKKLLCLLFQYIAENSSLFLQMDTDQNRNFRPNSGQNRQFREAGGLQTDAPRPSAHMQNSDRARSFREAATHHSAAKKLLCLLFQYIAENSSFFLPMDTDQNRNFRQNSGQNRRFREAGGLQTDAPRPSADMQNSDRARSFREAAIHHSAAKKLLSLLFQYIAENSNCFLSMENHASRGSATGSRGSGRYQSENPHQNRNFRQNSGQNRQRREAGGPQTSMPTEAAHVQNSSRGRSFPDAASPRGIGGNGGRRSGGLGHGGRGGAHYEASQQSSEPAATTAADATTGASGRASQATINSSSMIFRGSSTTSVTQFPGAPNQYGLSHHCSVLFSWHMGPAVRGLLQYVLATVVSIILFFIFVVRFNEIGNFMHMHADLNNRMING